VGATILVVDDSMAMRRLVCTTLRVEGFECIEATDGNDALERLADHRVELVLTDQWMEGMDGLELTKIIRSAPHLATVPVIVLTTDTSPDRCQLLRDAGALGVLEKTVDPEILTRTVRRALGTP
jgi:two-component system, chemotaxis family, chemotaxis protein CheY